MKKYHLIIASSTLFASMLIAPFFSNSPSGHSIIASASQQTHYRSKQKPKKKSKQISTPQKNTPAKKQTALRDIIAPVCVILIVGGIYYYQQHVKGQPRIQRENQQQQEEEQEEQQNNQQNQQQQHLVNSLTSKLKSLRSEEERKKVCEDIDQLMCYKKEEEDPFTFLNGLRSNNPNERIGPMQALFGKKPSDQMAHVLEHIRLNKYATDKQLVEAIKKSSDDNRIPYLHLCAELAFNKLFACLLDHYTGTLGQLLQAKNNNGENILHHLLRHGNLAGLQKLYKKVQKEDLTKAASAQAEGSGATPLHYLVQNRYLPIPKQTAIGKYFITYYKPTTDLCNSKNENYQATQKRVTYQILQDLVKNEGYHWEKPPCLNLDLLSMEKISEGNTAIAYSITMTINNSTSSYILRISTSLNRRESLEKQQQNKNVIKLYGYFNAFSKKWEGARLGMFKEDGGTPFSELIKNEKGNHYNFPILLNSLLNLIQGSVTHTNINLSNITVNKDGDIRLIDLNLNKKMKNKNAYDRYDCGIAILLCIAQLKLNQSSFYHPDCFRLDEFMRQYFWHIGLGKETATCPKEVSPFCRAIIEEITSFIENMKDCDEIWSKENYAKTFVDSSTYNTNKQLLFIEKNNDWTQNDIEKILNKLKETLDKIIKNPESRSDEKHMEAFIQEYFGEKKMILSLTLKEYQTQLNNLNAKEIASNKEEKKKFLFAAYYHTHWEIIKEICKTYYKYSHQKSSEVIVWIILQAFPPPGHQKHVKEAYDLIKKIIEHQEKQYETKKILDVFHRLSMPRSQYWVQENTQKTTPSTQQHPTDEQDDVKEEE